jgi:magnesium transporter
LVIRGLSLGLPIGGMLRREIITGLFIGLALAVAFLPYGLWRWDQSVAWAVSLSILGACATANVVAIALPLALNRFGIDPAFGSGPLATVVQDLLSVVIYLAIATAIVR